VGRKWLYWVAGVLVVEEELQDHSGVGGGYPEKGKGYIHLEFIF
jgi:hypothetical protein